MLAEDAGLVAGLERRMLAYEGLERFGDALADARAILLREPEHAVANRKQHELGRLVQAQGS